MPIKYFQADDIKREAEDVVKTLGWNHIDFQNLGFLRSMGSVSPRTIARCHALGKAMQIAMGRNTGFYLVEVISEKFDKLSKDEQTKTIIHELMHIPKTFGGGFIHHNMVHEGSVREVYKKYVNLKQNQQPTIYSSEFKKQESRGLVELKPNPVFIEAIRKKEEKWRWF